MTAPGEDAAADRSALQSLQQTVMSTRENLMRASLAGQGNLNPLPYRSLLANYERRARELLEKAPEDQIVKACLDQAVKLKDLNEF
jgi:hypothetical protein